MQADVTSATLNDCTFSGSRSITVHGLESESVDARVAVQGAGKLCLVTSVCYFVMTKYKCDSRTYRRITEWMAMS